MFLTCLCGCTSSVITDQASCFMNRLVFTFSDSLFCFAFPNENLFMFMFVFILRISQGMLMPNTLFSVFANSVEVEQS